MSRTSLHDIAQAAGLTRGAIYWHFNDKADLFNAMMERVTLPMEKAIHASAVPGPDDPVATIRHNFLEALRKTVSDPQARRVFEIAIHKVEYVGELQAVRARRLAVRNECLADVERGLKLAMRRGLLSRRMPARMAALGLQAVIEGLIQNWMLDPHALRPRARRRADPRQLSRGPGAVRDGSAQTRGAHRRAGADRGPRAARAVAAARTRQRGPKATG